MEHFSAVLLQRCCDPADDLRLLVLAERLGGDHVGIVRGPVADADLGVLADHLFEADRGSRVGRMEQRLALIRGGPLRAGDEILAARLRAVRAAARLHEARDERLLLVDRNWLHVCLEGT